MSSRVLALHIKTLLPYPPEVQRAMIEQSIANSRKGLLPRQSDGTRAPKRDLLTDWAPPSDH